MSDTKKLEIAMKWLEDIEGVKSPISALASAALSEIRAVDDQYPLGLSIPSPAEGQYQDTRFTYAEERYRTALEFYANESTYIESMEPAHSTFLKHAYQTVDAPIKIDRGARAREAISPSGEHSTTRDWEKEAHEYYQFCRRTYGDSLFVKLYEAHYGEQKEDGE